MTNFKVGDKVKITGNTNQSCNKVGDIGVVSSDVDYGLYRVSVNGRGSVYNRTLPSEMKLVTTLDVPIGYVGLSKDMNLKDGDVVKGKSFGYNYTVTSSQIRGVSILKCISNYILISRASEWVFTDSPDYTTHDVATHNGMPVAARKKAPVVKTIGVRIYAGTGVLKEAKEATVKSTNGVIDWSTLIVD
jgi:hypothetical protein